MSESFEQFPRTRDELRLSLKSDPLEFYEQLLGITKNFSLPDQLKIEIDLFGALLHRTMTANQTTISDIRTTTQVIPRGEKLIGKLFENAPIRPEQNRKLVAQQVREFFHLTTSEGESVFTAKDVTKKISSTFELGSFTLTLRIGEITGVVGENGNGKTSLLRIVAGEIYPTSGTIAYPLFSPNRLDWTKIKRSIGYVRQNLTTWNGARKIKDHLIFMNTVKGNYGAENDRLLDSIIDRLGLREYENSNWDEISGGYKLRFELAKQLIWKPKLLVLDEPLANLDIKTQLTFLRDLRDLTNSFSQGMAIIISSQNLYEIEKIADNLIFIRDGKPTYSGKMSGVGSENRFRCYEIDTDVEYMRLVRALRDPRILDIKASTFYKLIYTREDFDNTDFVSLLSERGIGFKYFRDVTHSTRLLFER
jgi:ABC-2 type transport system ATP-binding protein